VNLPAAALKGGAEAPVHETIMDSWARLRERLESAADETLRKDLAVFQAELRRLCEQDYAQRRRLVSRRYRLVDRLHGLLKGAAFGGTARGE